MGEIINKVSKEYIYIEEINNGYDLLFSEEDIFLLFQLIIKTSNEIMPMPGMCVHKRDPKQIVIGNVSQICKEQIIDMLPCEKIKNIYYCQARPNLECAVCFDHPLDHYPLMMIFEMARQLAIATSHKFYEIPFEGYMSIVNSLSFDFKCFIELDMPLIILCLDIDVKSQKGRLTRAMKFLFLQEGIPCASGSGVMNVFKKGLYDKMRKSSRCKIFNKNFLGIIPTNIDLLKIQNP
jgi:hypothetical protein